ncbi:dipeptide ABC transporter ATP-binding protein [Microtetraspora fusca]|uniref:dipeptide ABC transporter ATP-binding protein n=1 Tax=Microtetraspora fusca TaxID=1997 RepID=UPI0009FFF14F|nr:ABC transporter ATP-binding protein [Microtetraspora fusca]
MTVAIPGSGPDSGRAPVGVQGESLLEVTGLRVGVGSDPTLRPLLRGVDLTVARGEAVGLVGESGSGKSMLARSVVQLLPRGLSMDGSITYQGRELVGARGAALRALRGREISLIFQDPFTMLNPTMTCGDQVVELVRDENGRRLTRERRREEVERRLREVGIRDASVADAYPSELSGGMRQRVGIAAALALDPNLVIADEPSTALDVTTQREILRLLRGLQRSRGMGLILITHDLRLAFSMCDRLAVMYAGAVVEVGDARDVAERPIHPYTMGLISSEPPADRRLVRIGAIPGTAARADEHPEDCAFAPRCAWASSRCGAELPVLTPVEPTRSVACLRVDELTVELERARTQMQNAASVEVEQSAAGQSLVRVRELRKTYGSARRQVVALDGVDIDISAGESVGIVGESGSGKSTLAKCLLGLETADAGSVVLDGVDVSDYARLDRRDLATARRTVQMVFQDPQSTLNPSLSIGAVLAEAVRAGGVRDGVPDRVAALMDQVGLPRTLATRKPRALSGGQRQRVAIARALAVNPKLVVCDEAVSALDVSVQAQILNLLNELRSELGISIVFITHDLAVVRQVTDRVYVMRHGAVVEGGPTADVLDRPSHEYTRLLLSAAPSLSADWLGISEEASA